MLARFTICCLFLPIVNYGQVFEDRFETGDLSAWEIIQGNADLVADPVFEGVQSIRIWQDPNSPELSTYLRHRTFSDNYGSYYIYTRADGIVSDADFIFQFVDLNNYYFISNKPANTDNPEILLGKVVNGAYTELYRQGPVADRGEWLKFQVDRTCAGDIRVWINDRLVIEVVDQDITQPGSVGLAAWEQYSYFDSLAFVPERPFYEVNLIASACAGTGFSVGPKTYDQSGFYVDTFKTVYGCDSVVSLQLAVLPAIEVDTQFAICTGGYLQIGTHLYNYPGVYTDTLTATYGCDSIIHFTLDVNDGLAIHRDTTICKGDTLELERTIVTTPGTYTFQFQTNSDNYCDSLIEWSVELNPLELDLGPDLSWCPDQSLTLLAGDFKSYLWSNGATTNTLRVNQPGIYSLRVEDASGCTLRDSIVISEYCALQIYAPNIFSPNDDAINDRWSPAFSQPPGIYEVQIFDRWGNLVYTSRDPEEGWDGRTHSRPTQPGVYVWKIKADDQVKWGNLTLVR